MSARLGDFRAVLWVALGCCSPCVWRKFSLASIPTHSSVHSSAHPGEIKSHMASTPGKTKSWEESQAFSHDLRIQELVCWRLPGQPGLHSKTPMSRTNNSTNERIWEDMVRAGGMAEKITALDILAEDLGLVLSTHLRAHNCLWCQLQGTRCPLLASVHTTLTYTYTQTHKYYT